MNSLDGRVKANAAIVQAGVSAAISVYASNTTDVVLDIDGYFAPASQSTLAFYTLTPCRVADTRDPNQPPGSGASVYAGRPGAGLPDAEEQLRDSQYAAGLFVQLHRGAAMFRWAT